MSFSGPNSPVVVWAACFLWLMSLTAIGWSLLLFFCFGDLLLLTGTDLINAFLLLSAIVMLPTNVSMLCSIANGRRIDHRAKVVCCPLWLSIFWIILINTIAAIVCFLIILSCRELIIQQLYRSMKNYRSIPKYKRFCDNIQWSLKCCGLNSYKDWFNQDWYDKIRDYEWDPLESTSKAIKKRFVSDSVPLSCCKSGSCVSNYLSELGTYSINTSGCGPLLYRIVMLSLNAYFVLFLLTAVLEIIILKLIMKDNCPGVRRANILGVRHLKPYKANSIVSSETCQFNVESDDHMELSEHETAINK
ncbi:unnamed protein product [Chilo suppressalis]|uniref:Tetraspanin n=1 Tax=Chilo suppressalis TaxID=168631 RepID=A0ABN8BCN4_CHISP|nr:unnamed protein product [Chilo suppressalis]